VPHFSAKVFGALGWTVIADTAPKEAIGVTGALFNAAGSLGGIITPIAIGAIITRTGSYDGALLYVGLHVLAAVAAYWLLAGESNATFSKSESSSGGNRLSRG